MSNDVWGSADFLDPLALIGDRFDNRWDSFSDVPTVATSDDVRQFIEQMIVDGVGSANGDARGQVLQPLVRNAAMMGLWLGANLLYRAGAEDDRDGYLTTVLALHATLHRYWQARGIAAQVPNFAETYGGDEP